MIVHYLNANPQPVINRRARFKILRHSCLANREGAEDARFDPWCMALSRNAERKSVNRTHTRKQTLFLDYLWTFFAAGLDDFWTFAC